MANGIELPETFTGSLRTNSETVMAVISSKAKRVEDIVSGIKSRYKNAERHLSEGQVKVALKALTDAGFIMSENVATGVKGRPPKAYKLFTEETAPEATPAADA